MARAKLPTPLVTVQTLGTARDLGPALQELWRLFLDSQAAAVQAGRLSPSRFAALRRTAELAKSLPAHPDAGHVRQWLENMTGREPTTVRLHMWDLSSMYGWANANAHAGYNPLHRFRWKCPPPKRHAILDIHEKWPALWAVARDARERAFLALLRHSGLRIGEALALEARHVERTARGGWVLRVMQGRGEHSLSVPATALRGLKNSYSQRPVPVRAELADVLVPVVEAGPMSVWTGRGGQVETQTPFLFAYRSNDLARLMGALREVAADDFPRNDGWHVWRHTIAVELYRREVDVLRISRFMGHESVRYTQNYLRGFIGEAAVEDVFDGLDGPPPYAKATQAAMPLGVLGAVPPPRARGASPPKAEAPDRRVCQHATAGASREVQCSQPFNPQSPRKKAAR